MSKWNLHRQQASDNRSAHFRRHDEEAKMADPKFIGTAKMINPQNETEVVGTAQLEELPGGNIIAHVNMTGESAEILHRGFSFGSFEIKDDDAQS